MENNNVTLFFVGLVTFVVGFAVGAICVASYILNERNTDKRRLADISYSVERKITTPVQISKKMENFISEIAGLPPPGTTNVDWEAWQQSEKWKSAAVTRSNYYTLVTNYNNNAKSSAISPTKRTP